MSRLITRGTVLVAAIASAALAGCGAGQVSQTAQKLPSVEGFSTSSGDITVRNALIPFPDKGKYASGSQLPISLTIVDQSSDTKASALQPDVLVNVASESATGYTILPADPGSQAPALGCVVTGAATAAASPSSAAPSTTAAPSPAASASASPAAGSSASASGTSVAPPKPFDIPAQSLVSMRSGCPHIALTGLKADVPVGSTIDVTLTFQNAGDITLSVPVATSPSASPRSPNPEVPGAPE